MHGRRNGRRWRTGVADVADKAAAQGRQITAGNNYMRAGNYYYSAERFIPPGPEKMAMYRKALRCYHAAMERLHPEIERVEVPYENASLPAYFVKGRGSGTPSRPSCCSTAWTMPRK